LTAIVVVYPVRLLAGEAVSIGVAGKTMLHDCTSGTVSVFIDVFSLFAGPAFILRVAVQTFGNEIVANFALSVMREVITHALTAIAF
jgi:uncharacterized protein (DUF486 family)